MATEKIQKKLLLLLLMFIGLNSFSQSFSSQRINKNFLTGRINYKSDPGFILVRSEHSSKPIYLKEETYSAFIQMFQAARKDGINLKIVSGTRNFEEQKAIWEKKWKLFGDLEEESRMQKILEFSSMPATSRHHWGTDIDLNNLENPYFDSGKGKLEYEWLLKNAAKFGFYQVYTSKDCGRSGYAEEKWHWSYLPLASIYLKLYNELVDYSDIADFEGAHLAEKILIIAYFVNGIATDFPANNALASLLPEARSSNEAEGSTLE